MKIGSKYIVKPLERNISLYILVRGSIKPVGLLQRSLLHSLLSCYFNVYVQIYPFQIPHLYDIDTCTILKNICHWRCFTWENVLCHTLCLFVEYDILCGNKFLNLKLGKIMAPCLQATRHHLSQCWPSPMSSYGFTRLQWIKMWDTSLIPGHDNNCLFH